MEVMERGGEETKSKVGLCYLPFLGWIPAIAYLVTEKDRGVRWNAWQSVVVHGVLAGIYFVALPLVRATIVLAPVAWVTGGILGVGFLAGMLVLAVRAYEGREVRIPMISEWVDKIVK